VVNVPALPSTTNFLNAVSAVSANDVWAVGSALDPVTFDQEDLILHWDGTAWHAQPTLALPRGSVLQGVHAIAANDVWAVGLSDPHDLTQPRNLAVHWDGTRWTQVSVPTVGTQLTSLTSVAAFASDDVWAVGGAEDASGTQQTLVEHWDGAAWRVVTSPNRDPQGENANFLTGVVTAAPHKVTAVGAWNSLEQGNPGDRTLIISTSGAGRR
jgi:hypothetical protein